MVAGQPDSGGLSLGLLGRSSVGTQFEQPKQDLVSFCSQVVDRARAHLGVNACDQLLLELGGQLRRSQDLPPRRQGPVNCCQKVLHAALAATEMV